MELSEATLIKMIEDIAAIKMGVADIRENDKVVNKLLETHDGRLKSLEAYKNEMVGKVSIIALICGVIGWGITTAISYFLGKN